MIANVEIRNSAKEKGVKLWRVAEALGMTDSTFSRKLRHELDGEEKRLVMSAIEQLAAGAGEVA